MVSYGPIRRKYENTSERKIAAYEDIDDDIAKDINGALKIIREAVNKKKTGKLVTSAKLNQTPSLLSLIVTK